MLDYARALSETRYGMIALLDFSGGAQDFLSSGITKDEHEQFLVLPEGPELFEHFGKIVEPLRLKDVHSHIRALGLPAFNPPVQMSPILAILALPIRHRGWDHSNVAPEEEETVALLPADAVASATFGPADSKGFSDLVCAWHNLNGRKSGCTRFVCDLLTDYKALANTAEFE